MKNAPVMVNNSLNKWYDNREMPEVPEESFNVTEVESNGKLYRFIYTALSDWPAGEHHLQTIATFTSTVNDGLQDYPAGDYVLDYTVFVKP